MPELKIRTSRLKYVSLEERIAPATLPTNFAETVLPGAIASGTAMEFAPDGKLFVLEQAGTCKVYSRSGATWSLAQTNFLVNQAVTVNSSGERGLLGIAFDPNYATNRFVYLYHTTSTAPIHNRVIRVTANAAGDLAVAGSLTVLLDLNTLSATNHNGGAMHFGPDGKLYIATGENAVPSNAQSNANLLGKMLRMNADGSIPTDNPFYNTFTGNNRLIWAMGLRNPFTFSFQPSTGRMHINDVGQVSWEEINVGAAGANYGWPTTEGTFNQATFPTFTQPLLYYHHSNAAANSTGSSYTGQAITGGAFYNGAAYTFPSSYVGDYFFADYVSDWIKRYDFNTNTLSDFATLGGAPVDLKVGSDGALYYLSRADSRVYFAQYTGALTPYVVTPPASQTRTIGQAATFAVVAGGSGTLSYQWQRNGADIPGANSATYSIPSVALGDQGATFRAVVTNTTGNVTSGSASLTVTSPAKVASFTIADGSAQRSMIRNLTFAFDTIVSFSGVPANAFALIGPSGNVGVTVGAIDNSSGHSVVGITFNGPGLDGTSLANGIYNLSLFGSQVRDNQNANLDGDGDGVIGGDFTTTFHRLFGDGDGNRSVDQVDFIAFRNAFNLSSAAFDVNDNGIVNQDDFIRFRSAFGNSV